MCPGFKEREEVVMAVFRVEEEVVLVEIFFQDKWGIGKMKPRLAYKNE